MNREDFEAWKRLKDWEYMVLLKVWRGRKVQAHYYQSLVENHVPDGSAADWLEVLHGNAIQETQAACDREEQAFLADRWSTEQENDVLYEVVCMSREDYIGHVLRAPEMDALRLERYLKSIIV
jgi:hypothetical protein